MEKQIDIANVKTKCGKGIFKCPATDVCSAVDDNPITLRDIYNGLWKCRDFELSHLWQRSIFLATFLVLVFTGYGKLLEIHYSATDKCSLGNLPFHLIALGVSWVGMIVSALWFCMAKGSKAWYERYEKAIGDFVDCFGGEGDSMAFSSTDVANVAGFSFENMASEEERERREKLRSRNMSALNFGGANYSPSRINVFIGVLAFSVWVVVSMVHTGAIAYRCQPLMLWRVAMAFAVLGTIAATSFCVWLASDASPIASKWE